MSRRHEFYLGLGSNIEPEINLRRGIARLREHGEIRAFSSVWESRAVGSSGPNFLNLCIQYEAGAEEAELKQKILLPIETALGRVRTGDPNAPRTLDIDILLADGKPINPGRWEYPFVAVPLAELLPDYLSPLSGLRLAEEASRAQAKTWIVKRPGVLERLNSIGQT